MKKGFDTYKLFSRFFNVSLVVCILLLAFVYKSRGVSIGTYAALVGLACLVNITIRFFYYVKYNRH